LVPEDSNEVGSARADSQEVRSSPQVPYGSAQVKSEKWAAYEARVMETFDLALIGLVIFLCIYGIHALINRTDL
jgi:hypothetical protein